MAPNGRSSAARGDVTVSNPTQGKANCTDRLRRPHRKSRTGCRSCKAKKIKCDEQQPACGNCSRRGTQCSYFHRICVPNIERTEKIEIPPLRRTSAKKISLCDLGDNSQITLLSSRMKVSPNTVSVAMPISIATPDDQYIERRLLHHYHMMSNQASAGHRIWVSWIASIAITAPSVMNALLGFTAFHLRQFNDEDPKIREASHKYMSLAIRSHAEQIAAGFTENNAPSVIACCALILFHTSVNEPYISTTAGHKLPLHWFRPFHRAESFVNIAWPYIGDTTEAQALRRFLTVPQMMLQRATARICKFEFLLHGLKLEGSVCEDTIRVYEDAIGYLEQIYHHPAHAKLLRFPTLVSPLFIDRLEDKDPRSLAIAGYFFMLVKISKILWWVDGAAEREFAAIMAFMPWDWWPTMDWAIKEFAWTE